MAWVVPVDRELRRRFPASRSRSAGTGDSEEPALSQPRCVVLRMCSSGAGNSFPVTRT